MTHLYLIRHAAFISPHDQPDTDPALSPQGIDQAHRLYDRLVATGEIKADILLSSPLQRAQQTAAIIAPALGLPISLVPDVEEWRNQPPNGGPPMPFMHELLATAAEHRPFFSPYPGGESWAQFGMRACTALDRIAQQYAGKTIVIVCHGGIIEASFLFAFGLSPLEPAPIMMMMDPAYTSLTHWHYIGKDIYRWRLQEYNDAFHLRHGFPPRQNKVFDD